MDMSLLNFLIDHTENPYIVSSVLVFVLITVLLTLIKKILSFHSGELLFRNVKHLESSLAKLEEGSSDYDLFQEIMVQELLFANTRLVMAKQERQQIKEWTINRMVPISYIRKAWPNIGMEDGRLTPKISKFDVGYSVWLLFSLVVFVIGFVWVSYFGLLTDKTLTLPEFGLLIICGIFVLVSIKELTPILYARKIKYRLSEAERLQASSREISE